MVDQKSVYRRQVTLDAAPLKYPAWAAAPPQFRVLHPALVPPSDRVFFFLKVSVVKMLLVPPFTGFIELIFPDGLALGAFLGLQLGSSDFSL